jgi:hypothetical protein
VRSTQAKDSTGIIRIEFPGAPNAKDDHLEEISWEEFFEKFDEANLALIYQEETACGERSNFNKLVTPIAERHLIRGSALRVSLVAFNGQFPPDFGPILLTLQRWKGSAQDQPIRRAGTVCHVLVLCRQTSPQCKVRDAQHHPFNHLNPVADRCIADMAL